MNINTANQAYSFLTFLINGFGIGIIFDIFRILRKSFKTADIVTYIEDIIFWVLSGILTLANIIIFNNGEIRLYMFISIVIGVIAYMLSISRFFIKYSVLIINFIKKVWKVVINTIIYPIRIVLKMFRKVFLKPITFLFINIKQILSKAVEKLEKTKKSIKNCKKNNKNAVQKKDFNI